MVLICFWFSLALGSFLGCGARGGGGPLLMYHELNGCAPYICAELEIRSDIDLYIADMHFVC